MMLTRIILCQAPRAEVVLVLSRSRSVTPADRGNYDLIEAGYNYINSSRPPKILESPLDSKSLMSGWFLPSRNAMSDVFFFSRSEVCGRAPRSIHHGHPEEGGNRARVQSRGRKRFPLRRSAYDRQEDIHRIAHTLVIGVHTQVICSVLFQSFSPSRILIQEVLRTKTEFYESVTRFSQ